MISGFTSEEAGRQAVAPLYDRPRSRWPAHLFAVFVIALTSSLGIWQLQRAEQKAAAQAGQAEALARAPTAVDGVALNGLAVKPEAVLGLDGALVSLRGQFDAEHTLFLDNRTRQGVAGFHVLAPLRVVGSDQVVMVLRGWIPRDPRDRTRLPPLQSPEEPVEVQGLALRELAQPVMLGRPGQGDRETGRLWQHYDPASFAAWSGLAPAPLLVRQTIEPAYHDALARDWNQPGTGVDRHRGYALQWFAMAAVALGAWIWLGWRGRRPATVAADAAPAAATAPTVPTAPTATGATGATRTTTGGRDDSGHDG